MEAFLGKKNVKRNSGEFFFLCLIRVASTSSLMPCVFPRIREIRVAQKGKGKQSERERERKRSQFSLTKSEEGKGKRTSLDASVCSGVCFGNAKPGYTVRAACFASLALLTDVPMYDMCVPSDLMEYSKASMGFSQVTSLLGVHQR